MKNVTLAHFVTIIRICANNSEMKQSEFLSKFCKAIANNGIKGNARLLMTELAAP